MIYNGKGLVRLDFYIIVGVKEDVLDVIDNVLEWVNGFCVEFGVIENWF